MSVTLSRLQNWYHSQCNGEWEHSWGITIGTLDNPGWSVEIDLIETQLNGAEFAGHSYGVGDDSDQSSDEWIDCRVEGEKFLGFGGPEKLEEIMTIFLDWADSDPNRR